MQLGQLVSLVVETVTKNRISRFLRHYRPQLLRLLLHLHLHLHRLQRQMAGVQVDVEEEGHDELIVRGGLLVEHYVHAALIHFHSY